MAAASEDQPDSERFRLLMQRIRDGSEEAAWELVQAYAPHIRAVVRRMLDRRLRPACDSEDFTQAVWASWVKGKDRFAEIDQPQRFVGLLAAMARNKVVDEVRRRRGTLKNDVTRERSLDDSRFGAASALAATQPTPSQVLMADERLNQLLAGRPELHQKVLELKAEGRSFTEIAEILGINEKTARRVVKRLQDEGKEDEAD
jgi:RNA polymerase sigma factor (sigma-70 family)